MQTLKNIVRRLTLLFLYIGGLGYSAMLDIVLAISIMHFLNFFFFGLELAWYHYFLAAPIIGILPDITSTILQLVTQGKVDDAHHDVNWSYPPRFMILIALFALIGETAPYFIDNILTFFTIPLVPIPLTISIKLAFLAFFFMSFAPLAHIPLLMITLGLGLGWLLFSPFWGIVIAVAFFLHFLHDSCCLDFGLKWLWPFSSNQFHFGGRLVIGKKIAPLPFKFVHTFKPEKIDRSQYMDAIEWVRNVYLTPTRYVLYETMLSGTLALLIGLTAFENPTHVLYLTLAAIGIYLYGYAIIGVSMMYQMVTGEKFES